MQPITLPQKETELVIAIIAKAFAPCPVFAFGYRNDSTTVSSLLLTQPNIVTASHHFDLLVFSNKAFANGGSNVANAIAESSNKTITASVLLHKVTDLVTKQPVQQWFFDHVLRYGQRLCLDTTAPPFLPINIIPTRDAAADKTYWLKCVEVAQFNIQAATESEQLNVELCKIALLNTAAVQVALGLLRVFLGYTPNEFGLNYLLQLCGHFTALPAQIFRREIPKADKRYKMLCAPPSMLNHWTRLNAAEHDFLWLLDACKVLVHQANEMAMLEIDRFENTSTKPFTS